MRKLQIPMIFSAQEAGENKFSLLDLHTWYIRRCNESVKREQEGPRPQKNPPAQAKSHSFVQIKASEHEPYLSILKGVLEKHHSYLVPIFLKSSNKQLISPPLLLISNFKISNGMEEWHILSIAYMYLKQYFNALLPYAQQVLY